MVPAYIDPGYGALVWQAAVAAVIGLVFFFRHTVMGYGRRLFGKQRPSEPEPESVDEGASDS